MLLLYNLTTDSSLAIPSYTVISSDKHFEGTIKALNNLKPGEVLVLTFHGVPDLIHPNYSTTVENLKEILLLIKQKGYKVLAMKDL